MAYKTSLGPAGKVALPHLNADSTVVVVGVGGLGHMAIQLLRVLAPVRIVAADVPTDGAVDVYARLKAGQISDRAVLIPA